MALNVNHRCRRDDRDRRMSTCIDPILRRVDIAVAGGGVIGRKGERDRSGRCWDWARGVSDESNGPVVSGCRPPGDATGEQRSACRPGRRSCRRPYCYAAACWHHTGQSLLPSAAVEGDVISVSSVCPGAMVSEAILCGVGKGTAVRGDDRLGEAQQAHGMGLQAGIDVAQQDLHSRAVTVMGAVPG